MLAALMRGYGGAETLSVEQVRDPAPGPGELVVRVEAAALNHLDIDLRAGTSRIPLELPHILGCEGVGRVEYVPPGSGPKVSVGDRVMMLEELPCGRCRECVTGRQNLCDAATWLGVSRPGCYAQLIAVPSEGVLVLPEERDAFQWAAVQAAFGTAWHMLITRGALVAGERVLINGRCRWDRKRRHSGGGSSWSRGDCDRGIGREAHPGAPARSVMGDQLRRRWMGCRGAGSHGRTGGRSCV